MDEKKVYLIKDEDNDREVLVALTKAQLNAIYNFIEWLKIDDCYFIKKIDTIYER